MDNRFLDDWLPNIVVNAVFYLLERPRRTVAVISAWLAMRWLRQALASHAARATSRDLVPDPSTGQVSAIGVSPSTATVHLTGSPPLLAPHYRAPPNLGQFVLASEPYATHRVVQEVRGLRWPVS